MHTLPKLSYSYDALEPHIDSKTMEIHHTKHHQAYIDKLNAALDTYPELQSKPLDMLLKEIESVPADIRQAVINHGGGHANHSLFWEIITPSADDAPVGLLKTAIDTAFGGYEMLRNEFANAGVSRFGSGWAWLVVDPQNHQLSVISTPNQDSPLMQGLVPVLGLDVWEHAYYLKYQNRRPDYVEAFWNIVNWTKANEIFESIK